MPWYIGEFPSSYKNQPARLREKAVEIVNALLEEGTGDGIAIATGLKRTREYLKKRRLNRPEKASCSSRRFWLSDLFRVYPQL